MPTLETVPDEHLCALCLNEHKQRGTPLRHCHELLCRAFAGRSSEAMRCVLETYGAEFIFWVTTFSAYARIEAAMPHLEPGDIVQDVFVKLFKKFEQVDCYTSFPELAQLFVFIRTTIRNYEIDLSRQIRKGGTEIDPPLPNPDPELMDKIDACAKGLLSEIEYLVYEHWIYGVPDREAVSQKVGNQLNAIKRRVRNRLHDDPTMRGLLGLD